MSGSSLKQLRRMCCRVVWDGWVVGWWESLHLASFVNMVVHVKIGYLFFIRNDCLSICRRVFEL